MANEKENNIITLSNAEPIDIPNLLPISTEKIIFGSKKQDDLLDTNKEVNSSLSNQDTVTAVKAIIAPNSKTIELGKTSNYTDYTKEQISFNKIDSRYKSKSGGRLVDFDHLTGSDDDTRRAFFKISGSTEGNNSGLAALKESLGSDSTLIAIVDKLISSNGFTNFIMLGMSENHAEKQSISQTINDYFVATFAGSEPQLLDINGLLPFDASESSWFVEYMNVFKYIFRASILAKYKLQLHLILPDLAEYICYPTVITSSISSPNDTLCQFHMTCVVVKENMVKAWGISTTNQQSITEAVEEAKANADNKQITMDNATPSEVGKTSSKKAFLKTAKDFINTAITGKGTSETAKGVNTVNKVLSSVTQATGAIDSITGSTYGQRFNIKNFIKL